MYYKWHAFVISLCLVFKTWRGNTINLINPLIKTLGHKARIYLLTNHKERRLKEIMTQTKLKGGIKLNKANSYLALTRYHFQMVHFLTVCPSGSEASKKKFHRKINTYTSLFYYCFFSVYIMITLEELLY